MPQELTMLPRRKGLERTGVRVLEVRRPTESLVEFRVERPAGFEFAAGQFVYFFLPDGETRRAYSIASAPYERGHLAFTVKRVEGGPTSTYLYGVEVGNEVQISRALGSFAFRTPPDIPAVFLATGTGVGPFRSMIRQITHEGDSRDLWLFLGSRESENLPFRRDFELSAARDRQFRFIPVLSHAPLLWEGDRGWIQEAYLKRFYHARPHHAYICGLKRMVDDVRLLLKERGVPAQAIHVERYD